MKEKKHIKMKADKTFCGRAWSAWRSVQTWKGPQAELLTTTYAQATCENCKRAMESLAQRFVDYGHADDFVRLLQGETIAHQPSQLALPLNQKKEE